MKGQIGLPVALRKASGLTPGMRVKDNGKSAQITPAPAKQTASLKDIQALLKYHGHNVAVSHTRVTDHKLTGWHAPGNPCGFRCDQVLAPM